MEEAYYAFTLFYKVKMIKKGKKKKEKVVAEVGGPANMENPL